MKRVVITGMGAITPLGLNVQDTWENLLKGKSGIKKIPKNLFDTENLDVKIAGFISDFEQNDGVDFYLELNKYLSYNEIISNDRFIHLGLIATDEAIKDANFLPQSEEEKMNTGVIVGTGMGSVLTIKENVTLLDQNKKYQLSPYFITSILPNMLAGKISIKYNLHGTNYGIVGACASGACSILEGYKYIRYGEANVMICGAAEASLSTLQMAGFSSMRCLSKKYNNKPNLASRPWDIDRDGMVISEGAGILVLEEFEHARKRNAKIYCEIVGCSSISDSNHITTPPKDGKGAFISMKKASEISKIQVNQIDYINAHATSTVLGDISEINAINRLFNNNKDALNNVHISSIKGSIGHLLGASGSINLIFTIMSLNSDIIPGTFNLYNVDDSVKRFNICNQNIEKKIKYALSNAFGFGGINCSIVIKKYE